MAEHQLTIEELTIKIEKELKAKMEAEAKVKAEAEAAEVAKEKALREKIEKEFEEKKAAEIKAAQDKADLANSKPNQAPGAISGKYKMTKDEQMIMDAVTTKEISADGVVLDFKFDLQECEDKKSHAIRQSIMNGTKAAIDGSSSYGAEAVAEEWGNNLYMRMGDLDGNLMELYPKVPMSTNIQNISEILGDITVSGYSSYTDQNTAIENVTASANTTGELVLNARTILAKQNVYNRTTMDSKYNLIRGLSQKMGMKIGSKISASILNGDTTATHMDDDLEAAGANIPEAMWKGQRKLIMAGSLGVDGTDAAYTLGDLESVRAMMGKYALGVNKRRCHWVFGVTAYNKLIGLLRAQTSAPVIADFTLKNGEVDTLYGHKVVVSEHQREDLEIDGYYDESGTAATQGFISLTNASEFVIGMRETLSLKIVPDPLNGRRQIQGITLLDYQPFESPSTTISTCSGLYGFTS